MKPNDFKRLLAARPEAGLTVAAHRARDAALAASDRGEALAGLGALVADRAVPPRLRIAALLGAVEAARIARLPLPAEARDAVEDPLLVDAALQYRLTPALTATLFDLPDGESERRIRRAIGRKLFASGERGPQVTRLLLDAGEYETAVRAAVDDFLSLPTVTATRDVRARVFAEIALEWLVRAPDRMFVAFKRAVTVADPTAPARLAAWLDGANGQAELKASARHLLVGARTAN